MITISTLIASKAEIKSFLNLSVTTYDDQIDLWNPIVQDELLNDILMNNFGAMYLPGDDGYELTEPVFPQELKPVIARMIAYNLTKTFTNVSKKANVKSFRLADYSVTYPSADEYVGSYPISIVGQSVLRKRKMPGTDLPINTVNASVAIRGYYLKVKLENGAGTVDGGVRGFVAANISVTYDSDADVPRYIITNSDATFNDEMTGLVNRPIQQVQNDYVDTSTWYVIPDDITSKIIIEIYQVTS